MRKHVFSAKNKQKLASDLLFRNWLMDPVSEINLRQSGMVDSTRHVELSLVIEFVIVTAGLVIYLA